MPALLTRTDSPDQGSSGFNPIYIAGIALAGAIGLGREDDRGASFLNVKGLVKEDEKLPDNSHGMFSRAQLNNVVLPSKAITRSPEEEKKEIFEFHRQSGNFPAPFKPFAPSPNTETDKRSSGASWVRQSFMSGSFMSGSHNRFSVISASSGFSSASAGGTTRKIKQTFTPVLPDELLVSLGESLTVIQSFDDGWCVVGRENTALWAPQKSLFQSSQSAAPEGNVEMGVVPAWAFMKPVKGLKAERPIRSSSLGITVQMQGSDFSSRDEIMSWSNF
ncbi:hypothetical protein D9758_003790 [Tetrapyrgos nigripes]|uniref:SH3 domain-containing protein n=1 Tax=Tetrapyrgos nigripes TaxID=182062 RepID=A0A8H5GM84_9AGAR|nr:hypothetical protein D9758_003790 [Tetrapyrgos nigripes]